MAAEIDIANDVPTIFSALIFNDCHAMIVDKEI